MLFPWQPYIIDPILNYRWISDVFNIILVQLERSTMFCKEIKKLFTKNIQKNMILPQKSASGIQQISWKWKNWQ